MHEVEKLWKHASLIAPNNAPLQTYAAVSNGKPLKTIANTLSELPSIIHQVSITTTEESNLTAEVGF